MAKSDLSYEDLLKHFQDTPAPRDMDQLNDELDDIEANKSDQPAAPSRDQTTRDILSKFQTADTRTAPVAPEKATVEPSKGPQVLSPQLEDPELKSAQQKDAIINTLFGHSQGVDKFLNAVSNGQYKVSEQGPRSHLTDTLLQQRAAAQDLLNQKQRKEELDPNSQKSRDLRDILKKHSNTSIPDNLSYHDLTQTSIGSTLMNNQTKQALMEQKLDNMQRIAELRAAITPYQQQMLDIKKGQADTATLRRLDQAKKQAISGGGPAVNQARVRVTGAQNMFNTVGVDPNSSEKDIESLDPTSLNKINRTQVVEMAMELNRQLTNAGTPAQATIEKLVPKNILMDSTKFNDYFTNKLNPAQQADFIKQSLKIAARTKRQAEGTVRDHVRKSLSGMKDIRDSHPQQYNEIMQNNGLNPEEDVFSAKPQAAAPEIKEVGGKKYQRVEGGWKLVE